MRGPKHPRRFTEEFKRQIVDLYRCGKPLKEIEEEYDLGHSTVCRWIKTEVDVLKQAALIFAQK